MNKDSEPEAPLPGGAPATKATGESTTQHNWLIQIQDHIPRDLDHIVPISSCIFPIPDPYSSAKPESFAPQLIAIGPFHHFLNALMLMETFKLGAAKRARTKLRLPEFAAIVEGLEALAPEIRACYAKHLTVNDHILAWIMCIDGLFLIELLTNDGDIFNFCDSSLADRRRVPLDSSEMGKIEISVLADIMKLENQIPIFVLEEIWSFNHQAVISFDTVKLVPVVNRIPIHVLREIWSLEEDEEVSSDHAAVYSKLKQKKNFVSFPYRQLVQFCGKISPFQARDAYPDRRTEGIEPRHLLDLLYHLILLMEIPRPSKKPTRPSWDNAQSHSPAMSSAISGLWEAVGKGNQQLVKFITVPIAFALQLIEIFGISDHLKKLLEEERSLIPSATKLKSAGVRFKAVTTVRHIGFQPGEKTLTLTELTWKNDQNTGIVLRNLIAYESVSRPESPILAGYCELIHSLVRTAEDLAVLIDAGVIRVEKKKQPEVAFMRVFEELGKFGEAKDKRVSETVAGVNGYYNGVLKVKLKATGKKCLQCGWTIVMVVAVVLLLGLFSVQTVCQLGDCQNLFKISSSSRQAGSLLLPSASFTDIGGGENLLSRSI